MKEMKMRSPETYVPGDQSDELLGGLHNSTRLPNRGRHSIDRLHRLIEFDVFPVSPLETK